MKIKDRVVPSAPFKNFESLENLVHLAKSGVHRIQIDLCDGKYVPSLSWPFTEIKRVDFEKIGADPFADVYLPEWESMNYSADLMCVNPSALVPSLVAYGVDEVIVHFRSLGDEKEERQEEFTKIVEMKKNFDLSLVLAVDTQTDFAEFLEFGKINIENINGFQVMGIDKIGFQGQGFSEASLDLVKRIKIKFLDTKILFDGGVNESTVESILAAGADVLCVGSYLAPTPSFTDNLQHLKHLMHEN